MQIIRLCAAEDRIRVGPAPRDRAVSSARASNDGARTDASTSFEFYAYPGQKSLRLLKSVQLSHELFFQSRRIPVDQSTSAPHVEFKLRVNAACLNDWLAPAPRIADFQVHIRGRESKVGDYQICRIDLFVDAVDDIVISLNLIDP